MKTLFFALMAFTVSCIGAEIVENLPAGGKYIYETKWDKITIHCTAEPATPNVLSKTCTCTQYGGFVAGTYLYRLSLKALLSNGKVAEMGIVDGLGTLDSCHRERSEKFSELCKTP